MSGQIGLSPQSGTMVQGGVVSETEQVRFVCFFQCTMYGMYFIELIYSGLLKICKTEKSNDDTKFGWSVSSLMNE